MFVSDNFNHHVCAFRPDGTPLRVLVGGYGPGDGQLDSPAGLALTEDGALLVCEQWNHRVQEVRVSDGAFVCKWGERGRGEGEFNGP